MATADSVNARQLALESLMDRQGMVMAHLERLCNERQVDSRESAFARELALGVVRRRRTLDEILRAFSREPNRRMPAMVRQLLRMGIYQLVFMASSADYAVVNETVAACKKKKPRQAAFVNALLRKVADSIGPVNEGFIEPDQHTVYLSNNSYRIFDKVLYPDRKEHEVKFFGSVVSLPDDLATRWLKRIGRKGLVEAVREAMNINARPPVVLRVNMARTTPGAVLEELSACGIEAVTHTNGRSIVLVTGASPTSLACFNDGRVSVQDPAATAAVEAMEIAPGMKVLDFCAAPGGKTMHIAEKLSGNGSIVAVDVNRDKLSRVRQNAHRCGWDNISYVPAEMVGSLDQCSFDRIIVDAPCSNTGVLARRVEARWRFSEDDFRKICADQRRLLQVAELFLAPGGKMLYSTCSVEPQENHNVVTSLAKGDSRLRILDSNQSQPHGFDGPARYSDGGYWALLAY